MRRTIETTLFLATLVSLFFAATTASAKGHGNSSGGNSSGGSSSGNKSWSSNNVFKSQSQSRSQSQSQNQFKKNNPISSSNNGQKSFKQSCDPSKSCYKDKCHSHCGPRFDFCYNGRCYDSGYCETIVEVPVVQTVIVQPVVIQGGAIQTEVQGGAIPADVVQAGGIQTEVQPGMGPTAANQVSNQAVAQSEELQKVPAGVTLTLHGENFGEKPGQAAMQVGEMLLALQVNKWDNTSATVTLPKLPLANGSKAKFIIMAADGKLLSEVPFELIPAQAPAQQAVSQK